MFSNYGRSRHPSGSVGPTHRLLQRALLASITACITGCITGCLTWSISITAWCQEIQPEQGTELATLRSEYRGRLVALAEQLETAGQPELARRTRQSIPERDPNRQYIFLPGTGGSETNEADSQTDPASRVQQTEKDYAAKLFQISVAEAAQNNSAKAYQLLNETLVYDPDHEQARAILGYRNRADLGWVRTARRTTAREARSMQKLVGWQRGTYWEIESPHFVVYSAAGEQQGRELADLLEQTWQIWRQVFFEYWCNDRILNQWIAGDGSESAGSRKYKVVLFRDRQQYLSDLAVVPNIEQSTGYYDEKKRASFFYAGDGSSRATWRHEIVHQLLQENAGPYKSVGERGHAWLVEGVAMYFESVIEHGPYVTLGGFDATRLQYARLRSKREGFFEPMQSLDAMGREELQNHPDVARLYTQSSGVSQFLMAANQGKYRDGFIRFVKDLYQRSRVQASLEERTLPLDQLDRHYMQFLQVQPDELEAFWLNRNPDALALGRAGLQDQHVERLQDCRELRWLELSENPGIGDGAVRYLAGLSNLSQLFLDVTAITDTSAAELARMKGLQELDLASTRFSDQGIRELGAMNNLQVLWLANTRITDACIKDLIGIPNLKIVDLRQTGVSQQGVQELKAARPNLEVLY